MNYSGGATGYNNMCACGVINSCPNSKKCNCYNGGSGWREDSGLLTDKSALPMIQIRLGDLDDSSEEGSSIGRTELSLFLGGNLIKVGAE